MLAGMLAEMLRARMLALGEGAGAAQRALARALGGARVPAPAPPARVLAGGAGGTAASAAHGGGDGGDSAALVQQVAELRAQLAATERLLATSGGSASGTAGEIAALPAASAEYASGRSTPSQESEPAALKRRSGYSAGFAASRVTRKAQRGGGGYRLRLTEAPTALREGLADFERFLTQKFFGQQQKPIRAVTAAKYADHMRGLLGWLNRERGVPLQELCFRTAFPSVERDGVRLAFDHVEWLKRERGIAASSEVNVLAAYIAAAKFTYHAQSSVRPGQSEKAYSDLPVVSELRGMHRDATSRARVAAPVSVEESKWIDWPVYLQLVKALEVDALEAKRTNGKPRTPREAASAMQTYLLFAILASVPDRQRTLRELQLGRTLFKDEGGYVIRHGPDDYKTGGEYGQRPPLHLTAYLTPFLDTWLSTHRAAFGPKHEFVFTASNGLPLSEQGVYRRFTMASYAFTGQRLNPHLLRHSIVSHLKRSSTSEQELESLALYMGHSVQMQRSSYDRRSVGEKVKPAVSLLETLNASALAAAPAIDG